MNVEKYLITFGRTLSSTQNVFSPIFKKSVDP